MRRSSALSWRDSPSIRSGVPPSSRCSTCCAAGNRANWATGPRPSRSGAAGPWTPRRPTLGREQVSTSPCRLRLIPHSRSCFRWTTATLPLRLTRLRPRLMPPPKMPRWTTDIGTVHPTCPYRLCSRRPGPPMAPTPPCRPRRPCPPPRQRPQRRACTHPRRPRQAPPHPSHKTRSLAAQRQALLHPLAPLVPSPLPAFPRQRPQPPRRPRRQRPSHAALFSQRGASPLRHLSVAAPTCCRGTYTTAMTPQLRQTPKATTARPKAKKTATPTLRTAPTPPQRRPTPSAWRCAMPPKATASGV